MFQPHTEISAFKGHVFHMKLVSRDAQNSNIFGTILYFEQYSGARLDFRDIIMSKGFCPTTTLGYVYSWAILFWAKGASNAKNDISKNS